MIVVDASVIVDFLLGRESTIRAVEDAVDGDSYGHLHAPELVEPEALNALRRLARSGAIEERRADVAVLDLGSLPLVRWPHAVLRDRAWALRDELTAYDATYLALAEALPATLLTGDDGLALRARRTLGPERVLLVA